ADGAVAGGLKGLVVRAVFLGGLGHEADVGHAAHGARIEGAVFAAEVDDGLVDASVATVRNPGPGGLPFAVAAVHLAAGADGGGHRGVDDHVARQVQVGDAFVGVGHGQFRTLRVAGFDVGLDDLAFGIGQRGDGGEYRAPAVVRVDAQAGEG